MFFRPSEGGIHGAVLNVTRDGSCTGQTPSTPLRSKCSCTSLCTGVSWVDLFLNVFYLARKRRAHQHYTSCIRRRSTRARRKKCPPISRPAVPGLGRKSRWVVKKHNTSVELLHTRMA